MPIEWSFWNPKQLGTDTLGTDTFDDSETKDEQQQLQQVLAVDKDRLRAMHGNAVLSRYPTRSARVVPFTIGYDWFKENPIEAWGLIATVAICSCLLVGYMAHRPTEGFIRLLILPVVLSIAFFLIADIDSPRRGAIRVLPQNLISLAQSLLAR